MSSFASGFTVYAYRRVPQRSNVTEQNRLGINLGFACFPTPFTGGSPQPDKIFNNLRHEPILGTPDFPSTQAPSTLINKPGGVSHAVTASLFGFIRDDGAANPNRFSVTNLVVLRIQ